jgi:LuxR family maltose regulon positive regulatory protein
MDYLVGEVLSQQSLALQEFLLRTSILERFCAPLCDAVLDRQENQIILQELDQANLFLVSLDFEGNWYRYHHLFQELLGQRLHTLFSAEEISSLHARASAWFAANDLIEEAMDHAVAAGDVITAARLVERNYWQAVNQGQIARLRRWMGRLPEEVIMQRPALLMARCWLLHREFKLEATVPVFMHALDILENPEPDQELDLTEEECHYIHRASADFPQLSRTANDYLNAAQKAGLREVEQVSAAEDCPPINHTP